MVRLIFTDHVKEAMMRRGVTTSDVEVAWENHHTTYPGTNPKRDTIVRVGTGRNGKPLAVVVDGKKPFVIVTAYWKED